MSIAVCDDDTKIQSIVQEYICKYSMEKDMDIKVDCYDSGEELCNQYQRGKYDLIFLDIEFKVFDESEEESLEKTVLNAHKQIEDKNYDADWQVYLMK